ncbi:MAG: hypothetical protein CMJ74_12780 [Planctomycetaceae bacterium]|nr:hypothetical protein [Planctomycetaceae bacterium]
MIFWLQVAEEYSGYAWHPAGDFQSVISPTPLVNLIFLLCIDSRVMTYTLLESRGELACLPKIYT